MAPKSKVANILKRTYIPREWHHNYAFAVIDNGEIVCWGTNPDGDVEYLFEAASLTKVVTAYATVSLLSDKKINLDDSIDTYINGSKISQDVKNRLSSKGITFRHLLQHTAGLADYQFNTAAQETDIKHLLETVSLFGEPGKTHNYSNVGYVLIQCLIEEISDVSFEEYLLGILKKLEMQHSTFSTDEASLEKYGKPLIGNDYQKGPLSNRYLVPKAPGGLELQQKTTPHLCDD